MAQLPEGHRFAPWKLMHRPLCEPGESLSSQQMLALPVPSAQLAELCSAPKALSPSTSQGSGWPQAFSRGELQQLSEEEGAASTSACDTCWDCRWPCWTQKCWGQHSHKDTALLLLHAPWRWRWHLGTWFNAPGAQLQSQLQPHAL